MVEEKIYQKTISFIRPHDILRKTFEISSTAADGCNGQTASYIAAEALQFAKETKNLHHNPAMQQEVIRQFVFFMKFKHTVEAFII